MATDTPAISDLRRKQLASDDEIDAATDAYCADPSVGPFRFKSGHTIDVAEAIRRYSAMGERLAKSTVDDQAKFWRGLVRTAILLALPSEA